MCATSRRCTPSGTHGSARARCRPCWSERSRPGGRSRWPSGCAGGSCSGGVRRRGGLAVQPRLRGRRDGIGVVLQDQYEYLRVARQITDFPAALREFVSRIPYDSLPDNIPNANWPVHIAGHPPGALGFFVSSHRIGLGGGFAGRRRRDPDRGHDRRRGDGHAAPARCRGRWPVGRRRSWCSVRRRSGRR